MKLLKTMYPYTVGWSNETNRVINFHDMYYRARDLYTDLFYVQRKNRKIKEF